MIVDTGSADTAFPCYGCQGCGAAASGKDPHPADHHHNHIDSLYLQNESSCFRYLLCSESPDECPGDSICLKDSDDLDIIDLPESSLHPPFLDPSQADRVCHIAMGYMEGSSWLAIQSVDRAYTGGSHFAVDETEVERGSFNLTFGCQTLVEGLFETQLADGIMGMMVSPSSYWWQLYEAGIIQNKQFSLCFTANPSITYGGSDAGAMVFGGFDERLHKTPMVFAEMIYSEKATTSAVEIVLERIHMRMNAGESIVPTRKRPADWHTIGEATSVLGVVDSGATSTHLTNEFLESFQDAFLALTGLEYDLQAAYSFDSMEQMVESLPTVIFQFKASTQNNADSSFEGFSNNGTSIMVALPPLSYMKYYPSDDAYAAKIFFRNFGMSFGANLLSGKDVFFDVENKRLGFAESSCDYLSLGDQRFNHSEAAWEAQNGRSDAEPGTSSAHVPLATLVGIIAVIASFGLRAFYKKTRVAAFQHEQIMGLQEFDDFDSYSDDDVFETEMVQTNSSSDSTDDVLII